MSAHSFILLLLLPLLACSSCYADDPSLMGYWPFDGTLADASGQGRAAIGEARYAEGKIRQALDPQWQAVRVESAPGLELAPGLMLDCWVWFDEAPRGYEMLVIKDKEYQLRVDALNEGGDFSFFVYLDGWEPRIGTNIVPEAKRWYHLVARWTGTSIALEVDGKAFSAARRGVAQPTDSPLQIGGWSARIDELRIVNAVTARNQELARLIEETSAGARLTQTHFGGTDGWDGWRGLMGAKAEARGATLVASAPSEAASLVSPALEVDTSALPWVSLDLDAPGVQTGHLTFVTDRGEGTVGFRVWGKDRTCLINMAASPHWGGTLRLLALSFPEEHPRRVTLANLWLSREPEGKPLVYVRNLAPGRAKLRTGREEEIVATVRSLGKRATGVQATLAGPDGLRLLDPATQPLPDLPQDSTHMVRWRVQADKPLNGEASVSLSAEGAESYRKAVRLSFTRLPDLPPTDYVPPPKPVQPDFLTLMHYCPLWKEGTHYGWQRIEPWPERRPAIGWYDEGTPEVADWHIKYALEHGIQGFIYCWYRTNLEPEIQVTIGHAVHDGLLKARYADQFKFAIMWENGCAAGVKSREDLLENVLPYWMEHYFKHPSYVKIDNRPLLYIWVPGNVTRDLGGSEQVRAVFDEMREACKREGFDGLWIVGCVSTANRGELERMAEEGWDASSAYAVWGGGTQRPEPDIEGIPTIEYLSAMLGQTEVLKGKRDIGALLDIPTVMQGWDPRPWHGPSTASYQWPPNPEQFKAACRRARALLEDGDRHHFPGGVVCFDNWNEFGEGHYLEPTTGFGFEYLDAIKEVFCPNAPPCEDLIPEDVGLEPPEHVYALRREILGGWAERERTVVDNLVGWWRFDEEDDMLALDSSASGFHAWKQDYASAPGRVGKGFLCQGGTVTVGAHRLFWPTDGITIEVWLKTDTPDQSDHWMVNTIGHPTLGYRLGLTGGKLAWQIPQSEWSHLLQAPEPLPLGEWVHVAATYDNRVIRLYVNGAQVASLERLGFIGRSDANLCIGGYSPGNARAMFDGILDEVRLYDRALTAEEVRYRAEATSP